MPELMRSILGRFHNFLGSHKHARRYKVRLPLTISLLDSRQHTTMSGYAHDISRTGLALVVPSIRLGDRYLTGGDLPLAVQIELPEGSINTQVVPVRYEKLDENSREWGYLIGVRITEMADSDRERLFSFLLQASQLKATTPKATFAHRAPSL